MNIESLKHTIEDHFVELLDTHMAKSPMLNLSVNVEAVGFSKWQGNHLCVVITPWFMSLYLVPEESSSQKRLQIKNGTMTNRSFMSGSYSFTAANDELIGIYETCTLFSSMSDFSSHDQARDVALETVRLLLGNKKTSPPTSESKRQNKPSRRELFRSAIRRSKST